MSDTSVLKISTARFYTAPVGTPLPEDLRSPGVEWKDMGNTSLTDILSSTSTGGEVTVLPSLQNKALRQTVSARTEAFKVNLLEFTRESLAMYYGSNAVITAKGNIQVPNEPVPTEVAWLVVLFDGESTAGVYAARASVFRNSDLALSNTDEMVQLPLTITPLSHNGSAHNFEFIPPYVDVTP